MKKGLYRIIIPLMFLSFLSQRGLTEDTSQPEVSPIEPEAMTILINMAENLSTLQKVKVKIKNGYDAVQRSGQKIEFESMRVVKYKRPNLCRFDVTERDGSQQGFVFDGNNITVFDEEEKVYATTPKPGTCDNANEYFKNELKMPLPLSQLFNSKLAEKLKEMITEATIVEEYVLDKDKVSHIAFRTEQVDVQVWINNKKNLPNKLIISYKNVPEHPQFWAYFKDWDLSPWLKDSDFNFKPPKDYEKIMFSPVKVMEMKEEKENVQK